MLRVVLRHSIIAAIFAGLLAAAGEVGLRSWVHFRFAVPGKSIGRWQADSELGARMAGHVYDHRMETNDQGFRGAEDVHASDLPGALQVVVYGGSTALCWNLGDDETWPRRLESALRERPGGLPERLEEADQVLNAGDINWSIAHVLIRARKELSGVRPDVVLLYSGINEVGNRRLLEVEGVDFETQVLAGRTGLAARSFPQAGWLGRHSLFFRAVQGRFLRPFVRWTRSILPADEWEQWQRTLVSAESPPVPPDPITLDHYLRTLEELAALCRDYGIRLVFVVQARGERTVALDHLTSYSRAGGEFLRERGEIVVDAQNFVDAQAANLSSEERGGLFTPSGMHYSSRGAELFAAFLAEKIPWNTFRSKAEPILGTRAEPGRK